MGYASGIEINSFQVFLGFLMLKWSWTTCDWLPPPFRTKLSMVRRNLTGIYSLTAEQLRGRLLSGWASRQGNFHHVETKGHYQFSNYIRRSKEALLRLVKGLDYHSNIFLIFLSKSEPCSIHQRGIKNVSTENVPISSVSLRNGSPPKTMNYSY
jgi:hypothetical protein